MIARPQDAADAGHGIRSALVADAAAMARLHASIFDEAWPEDVMKALIMAGDGLSLIASSRDGAPILGFACARIAADEAELLSIGVGAAAQRCGIGSALLHHLVALLPARGIASLFLEVAEDNAAARALYRRHRFIEVGRRRGYYVRADRKTDALVMRRDLTRAS